MLRLFLAIAVVCLLAGGLFGADANIELKDLAPRDPIEKYMVNVPRPAANRAPAGENTKKDDGLKILRPDMGQGEHMAYGTTDSDPSFTKNRTRREYFDNFIST